MRELRLEYWSRVTKGRNVSVDIENGSAFCGKQMDSVLKETLAVSVMREHLETVAVKDEEHNPPLQLQERPHRLREESQKEIRALEEKAFQD